MTTTLRAALSAVLLAGFYVVALAIIVGMGALSWWAFQSDAEAAAAKLGFFTAAIAVGVVVALWKVARARPEPEVGPTLTPADAPALWEAVRELAAEAGTRAPDDIRLLPDVNAAVSEDTRLLGLVGGTRHLYLGVPLLQTLDVGQLRSVLAHELGPLLQQPHPPRSADVPRQAGDRRDARAAVRQRRRLVPAPVRAPLLRGLAPR